MELQLYIEDQRVELFKEETVSITDSIQNIRDISKVFTAFSKQFNLPASKTVNKIFKHFYNFNITDGIDSRYRLSAEIRLNGITFKTGKIRLDGVNMQNNSPQSYKVVFFGDTVELKEELGDDKLVVLNDLRQYDHRQSDILNGFITGLGVGGAASANRNITYPMISRETTYFYDSADTTSNDNLYHASIADIRSDLKPAIKMTDMIAAIESQYDLTFSSDFFGSDVFDELYIWGQREKEPLNFVENKRKVKFSDYTLTIGSDERPLATTSSITYTISIIFQTASAVPYSLSLIDLNSGKIYYQQSQIIGNVTTGAITIETTTPADIDLDIKIVADSTLVFTSISSKVEKFTDGVGGGLSTYTYPVASFLADWVFIQDELPDMKVIDLLTTLFKMFNLTVYKEDDVIVVKTLDDYLSSGTTHDITKYIDINKSKVNRFTPFSNIAFNYSKPVTQTSLSYLNNNGQVFGDLNYNQEDKFDGNSFTVGLNTEHSLLINLIDQNGGAESGVVLGLFTDPEDKPVKGAPYLFFNRYNDVTGFEVLVNGTYSSYNAPANTTSDGNHTLNFGSEFDEYDGVQNDNSLFSRFYEQYIVNSFDVKARIVNFTAQLPLQILSNYGLNDVFVIGNNSYFINSIKTNLITGKSDLELITKLNDYTASVLT